MRKKKNRAQRKFEDKQMVDKIIKIDRTARTEARKLLDQGFKKADVVTYLVQKVHIPAGVAPILVDEVMEKYGHEDVEREEKLDKKFKNIGMWPYYIIFGMLAVLVLIVIIGYVNKAI
jgi:hypothetical protein